MLKQINNRFYKYFDKNANMLFTFEKGGEFEAGDGNQNMVTFEVSE